MPAGLFSPELQRDDEASELPARNFTRAKIHTQISLSLCLSPCLSAALALVARRPLCLNALVPGSGAPCKIYLFLFTSHRKGMKE